MWNWNTAFEIRTKKSRVKARNANRRALKIASLESLEGRAVPAVTAIFSPGSHVLSILGDTHDNSITISRTGAGKILVNNGAVKIRGAKATIANTSLIKVLGQSGNDTITVNESNGAMPRARLDGGLGNDVLTGGSGADMLLGGAGDDSLQGKGGTDILLGGDGNDILVGGTGNDQVLGEAGNDRMVWNPGDGTDVNEGGAGTDTTQVNGGDAAETFTINANGTRVKFDRTDPSPFSIDIGTTENLVLNANGGNDKVTAGNGLAPLIALTVDGGAGDDVITGGDGVDNLLGGDGNDIITGGKGNDVVILGAGDDTFIWNPGDGSDTVDGQTGADKMVFNGANVNENINISANGNHVRFLRDVANIAMDLSAIEDVDFNALGGADNITVNDLTGTGLTAVNLSLATTPGGDVGDGLADSVIVNGTNGDDIIQLTGAGGSFSVTGLSAVVNVSGSEGANDALAINALGGNDQILAAALPQGVVKLTVDAGAGDNNVLGSQGADTILGGDGHDRVDGNQGNDIVRLGGGDDTFIWDPGDGSDTVEGGDGADTMIFNGANVAENVDISANDTRVRFFRNIGNITMDLNAIERVDFNALGGADTVTVNDLTGTDLTQVNLNLKNGNAGDGAADAVIINGTAGNDTVAVAGSETGLTVKGLSAAVAIKGSEANLDSLTINTLAGDDDVDARNLAAGALALSLNGGQGSDILIGSQGNDQINGGTGNDIALMGAGDDTFVWNPGDGSDTVEGQDGLDRMLFNGANVDETINIAANGSHVKFLRDIGNIAMDLNAVEDIDFNALGGADTITVNDLSGTGLDSVNLNLAAALGGNAGDGQADKVIINGTDGDDAILAVGDANRVEVQGLQAEVNIAAGEAGIDTLSINSRDGNDTVDASGVAAGAISLELRGGAGDDLLTGGAGNDSLFGDDGNDQLIGGPGNDALDGGAGNNILTQD